MKKETLEEAANSIYPNDGYEDEMYCDLGEFKRDFFIEGAKWQTETDNEEAILFADWIAQEGYKKYSNGWAKLWDKGICSTSELLIKFKNK
jgi:hypothetical protein